MSSAVVPPPAPPPFKNRRGWLTAFGIAEILIGCLVLMFIAFAAIGMRSVPKTAATPPPDPRALVIGAIFYAIIAVIFVSIGIGSIQARRWARMAMLILGWIWLGIGVLTTALMAVLLPMILSNAQQQSTTPMPAGFNKIFSIAMLVVLALFFILLPLVFVLFYGSKNVKLTCETASAPTGPTKPVAVWIATIWFAFGTVGYLFVLARPG